MWLLLSLIALADIPPPSDYVEACTVELACGEKDGVLCGSSYFGEPDACANEHAPSGYTKACGTRGASVWDEVWCRPKDWVPSPPDADTTSPEPVAPTPPGPAPTPPAPTPPTDKTGCSSLPGAPWLGVFLPLALVRRRR